MKISIFFRKIKTLWRLTCEWYISTRGWFETYTIHGIIKRYQVMNYPKTHLPIVAIYITFHGDEFVESSVASIYPFVDKIVFFHSDLSWDGQVGGNTVKDPVSKWKKLYDIEDKIVEVNFDCSNQQIQREEAWNYVKKRWDYDFLMVIDTDEVWSPIAFERAVYHLKGESKANVFFPRMNFYIKSPYYRVSNTTAHHPAFLRKGYSPAQGIRGVLVKPRYNMQDVVVDHFHLVHYKDSISFSKQRRSHGEEKKSLGLSSRDYNVDFNKWEKEVWESIPNAKYLFVRKGYENTFRGIVKIEEKDLPKTVKVYSKKILRLFDSKTGRRLGEGGGNI